MTAWTLEYTGFDADGEGLREALCTVGNGAFATRGAAPFARADDAHYPGTYAAGVYDRLTTTVQGQDVTNEDIVNLPNWLPLTFRVLADAGAVATGRTAAGEPAVAAWDESWFRLADVDVLEYHHALDLRTGVATRRLRFRDTAGRRFVLTYRHLVSMVDPHVGVLEMTLVAENWSGGLVIRSALDGQVTNSGVARYRALRGDHLVPIAACRVDDETVLLQVRTRQSHVRVAEAARTRVFIDDERVHTDATASTAPGVVVVDHRVDVAQGRELRVEKVVTLCTSRDRAISEPAEHACRRLGETRDVAEVLDDHRLAWKRVWDAHQLRIDSDDEQAQMVLNLHIFHLLQTASKHSVDLDVGVPARGLHGEAYRGHIFWDELFVFPYLSLRVPELTRALLRYRHRRLPEARRLARQAGHMGAAFPWQSGSDGREESQTLHLNPRSGRWNPDHSHLQRHVNCAIAYNVWQYHQITGDVGFLTYYGGEVILEIARFLASTATYDDALDRFEIRGVLGPDEYHDGYPWRAEPGLDNNTYTNLMTVWVLLRALDVLAALPSRRRAELSERLRLHNDEVTHWEHITRRMRVCTHDDGILSQFEGYERLEEFDWDIYRERYGDISRLDRVLEAEGDSTNRYKVSKQADVLMLFYLFTADELGDLFGRLGYDFDGHTMRRTIDYYLERTSHGSTLSGVVHSWVLARSDRARSFDLFCRALRSDIDDIQGGTTPEGIHLGAMAGTVDMVQRGYTGLQPRGDVLWLNPALPDELRRLEFTIRYRSAWDILFDIDHNRIRVGAPSGSMVRVGYDGAVTDVPPGSTVDIPLT